MGLADDLDCELPDVVDDAKPAVHAVSIREPELPAEPAECIFELKRRSSKCIRWTATFRIFTDRRSSIGEICDIINNMFNWTHWTSFVPRTSPWLSFWRVPPPPTSRAAGWPSLFRQTSVLPGFSGLTGSFLSSTPQCRGCHPADSSRPGCSPSPDWSSSRVPVFKSVSKRSFSSARWIQRPKVRCGVSCAPRTTPLPCRPAGNSEPHWGTSTGWIQRVQRRTNHRFCCA